MQVAKRLNAVGIVTPLHQHEHIAAFYGTIPHGASYTKVKRATSPTARFFHVPNLWFRGWECLSARTAAQLVLCVYTQPHLMA